MIYAPSFPRYARLFTFLKLAQLSLALSRYRLAARSAIARLEKDATKLANIIREAWQLFVDLANRIQKSGVWRLYAPNWQAYCKQTWQIDSSRLSQLRSALPYALALQSAGQGNLLEGHIRKFRKHVPVESPYLASSYELGMAVAAAENRAPTEAMFRRAHEVLEESANTGGFVQLGESTIAIRTTKDAIRAVQETLKMVKKINLEEQSIGIKVKGKRVGRFYKLEADGKLPESFECIVYVRAK